MNDNEEPARKRQRPRDPSVHDQAMIMQDDDDDGRGGDMGMVATSCFGPDHFMKTQLQSDGDASLDDVTDLDAWAEDNYCWACDRQFLTDDDARKNPLWDHWQKNKSRLWGVVDDPIYVEMWHQFYTNKVQALMKPPVCKFVHPEWKRVTIWKHMMYHEPSLVNFNKKAIMHLKRLMVSCEYDRNVVEHDAGALPKADFNSCNNYIRLHKHLLHVHKETYDDAAK